MALNADTLLDRMQLKSRIRMWRLMAILALGIAAVATFGSLRTNPTISPLTGGYIARVHVEGVIDDDIKMHELLTELRDSKAVKAVMVRIDSPGGTAVGGEQLYVDLRAIAEKKPVVAVMRNMATSAGYLTAVAADQIFAREGTITGSVGVILQTAEFTNMADKLGITPITIKSGDLKASPSPVEKLGGKQRAALQASLDTFFQFFKGTVAERRQLPPSTINLLEDGRIFSGKQALKYRLIDAIGGEEEAVNWLETAKKLEKSLPVLDEEPEYEQGNPLFAEFKEMAFGKVVPDMLLNHHGLSAIWKP